MAATTIVLPRGTAASEHPLKFVPTSGEKPMNDRTGFASQGRSVVPWCLFLTLCSTALVLLLWTPRVGARQDFDQNRTFVFHGHRVSVALASNLSNPSPLRGTGGLAGLVPIPGGI